MLLVLLLAAQASYQPLHPEEPPVALVDFLGRRRECARSVPGPSEQPNLRDAFLACDSLMAEEAAYRARFAGDANAMAWLDDPPERFRMDQIVVHSWDGPPAADVRRVEQSGRTSRGRWRVAVDLDAANGRAAALTLSFPGRPDRTIWLEHALVPRLDPQSMDVAFDPEGRNGRLYVEMRFGFVRGWCGEIGGDDRPRVSVALDRGGQPVVTRGDNTNCGFGSDEVAPERYLTPPR